MYSRADHLPCHELFLERADLEGIDPVPLPDGYSFCFYRAGDRDAWISIAISAGEVKDREDGLKVWEQYYAPHEGELGSRLVFIADREGEKVATATAYYDVLGEFPESIGRLHWVSVRSDCQGRGLSRPLITYTLGVLRSLGYRHTMISTSTHTWLAVRLYMDYGFVPTARSLAESPEGWEMISNMTGRKIDI